MTEAAAAFYYVQLLRAVLHMHMMGYCHRDIKVRAVLSRAVLTVCWSGYLTLLCQLTCRSLASATHHQTTHHQTTHHQTTHQTTPNHHQTTHHAAAAAAHAA
jgi:serine/threonine protein kinase